LHEGIGEAHPALGQRIDMGVFSQGWPAQPR
jgi:hypothetical protein